MQKILMILICMFIGSAHATEMCAKNNTVVVPLDATIRATSCSHNDVEFIWWAGFPYGNIYGTWTSLSLQEIKDIQNNPDLTGAPGVLNTDSDELIGRSGTDANGNTRRYVYFKITHPMSSNWFVAPENPITIARFCYYMLSDAASGDSRGGILRNTMVGAIGASMAEKEPEAETE
jgi:hypothetical protein